MPDEPDEMLAPEEDPVILDIKGTTTDIVDEPKGGDGSVNAGAIPGGTEAVVVDGSGQVVDTATFNPNSGSFEQTGVGITVVTESSSVGSSDGSVSAGGALGGTESGVVPDGTEAVVVDGSGQVVDTAKFNASTGAFEQTGIETTVVNESSSDGSVSTGGPGGGLDTGTTEAGPPGEDPVPLFGTHNFMVDPSHFQFQPESDTRQLSRCVTFGVVYLIDAKPVSTPILLRIKVRGPRFRGGKEIDADRAARISAAAASAAGERLVESLNLGLTSPAQAQRQFQLLTNAEVRSIGGPAWEAFSC